MITIKLDVTKLDKARFFKGAKGTYADLILIETPNGQFGDFMLKQQVSKEEREARVQMPILGNGKWLGQSKPSPQAAVSAPAQSGSGEDEIPF